MARFYGGVHGNRGKATRLWTKDSGFKAFANGWKLGVNIQLLYDKEKDEDVAYVTLTSGSAGNSSSKSLGRFTTKDLK